MLNGNEDSTVIIILYHTNSARSLIFWVGIGYLFQRYDSF